MRRSLFTITFLLSISWADVGAAKIPCIQFSDAPVCIEALQETNERFASFLHEHGNRWGEGVCMAPKNLRIRKTDGGWRATAGTEQHPVSQVTWHGAVAACKARGARLCTGSEWEFACKGPGDTRLPYGNEFRKEVCNGFEAGIGRTVPVGSMKGCEGGLKGLFDMNGNVWDWTASCRRGKCEIRGGSYSTYAEYMLCVYWDRYRPENTEEYIGFRCCRDL